MHSPESQPYSPDRQPADDDRRREEVARLRASLVLRACRLRLQVARRADGGSGPAAETGSPGGFDEGSASSAVP